MLSYNGVVTAVNATSNTPSQLKNVTTPVNGLCTEIYVTSSNTTNNSVNIYVPCFLNSQVWTLYITDLDLSNLSPSNYNTILPNIVYPNNFYAVNSQTYIFLDQSPGLQNFAGGSINIFSNPTLSQGGMSTLVQSFSNSNQNCGLGPNGNYVFQGIGYTSNNTGTSSPLNIFLLDNLGSNLFYTQVNPSSNYSCSMGGSLSLTEVFASNNVFIPSGTVFSEFYIVNSYFNNSNAYYTMVLISNIAPIYQVNFYITSTGSIMSGGVPVIYNNYPGKIIQGGSFSRSQNTTFFSVNYFDPNGQNSLTAFYNFTSA